VLVAIDQLLAATGGNRIIAPRGCTASADQHGHDRQPTNDHHDPERDYGAVHTKHLACL
jgi:hypothetical protein